MTEQKQAGNEIAVKQMNMAEKRTALVTQTRWVSESAYVLRLEKKDFHYTPGQYLTLGLPDNRQTREYSIYSSPSDDFLEVLIKEVEDGFLSLKLGKVKVGDQLLLDGPFGYFNLEPKEIATKKHVLIATGTGISPFHSMTRFYKELNFQILHGVRDESEAYEREHYNAGNYTLCTSRSKGGDFYGRVTDYLKNYAIDSDTLVYLCGNSEMIYDAYDILMSKGLPSDNIRTEVYF